jgi:hypothetical protein
MMMMMQKENQMITTSDSCVICAVEACRIELFYNVYDDNFLSFSTNDNNNLSKMIQSDDYFSLKNPLFSSQSSFFLIDLQLMKNALPNVNDPT